MKDIGDSKEVKKESKPHTLQTLLDEISNESDIDKRKRLNRSLKKILDKS